MQMDWPTIVLIDFTALFVGCSLYAVALHYLRPWYIKHNKTWFVLVLGVVFVLAALAVLIPFGIVDRFSWSLFVLGFCVAGSPIVVGQLMQDAADRALTKTKRRNHDEDTRR